MKDIGKKIKEAREAMGISQHAAAEIIGCSQRSLCGWEQGKNFPRATRTRAIENFIAMAPGESEDAPVAVASVDPEEPKITPAPKIAPAAVLPVQKLEILPVQDKTYPLHFAEVDTPHSYPCFLLPPSEGRLTQFLVRMVKPLPGGRMDARWDVTGWDDDAQCWAGVNDAMITHWMPLPGSGDLY